MKKLYTSLAICTFAALSGFGSGAMYTYQHNQKAESQMVATCKAQPHLDFCLERKVAAQGVKYLFNGKEFNGGTATSALGANE